MRLEDKEGKIAELRKRAGLSQAQLAERLNVSQSFIAKAEAGQRKITATMYERILQALNLEEEEEEEPARSIHIHITDGGALLSSFSIYAYDESLDDRENIAMAINRAVLKVTKDPRVDPGKLIIQVRGIHEGDFAAAP